MTFQELEAAALALDPERRARLAERLRERLNTQSSGGQPDRGASRSPADSIRDAQSGVDHQSQDSLKRGTRDR